MSRPVNDHISLVGIHAQGRHGVFDHEREHDQTFVVDVELELPLRLAAETDNLDHTIDYVATAKTVIAEIESRPVSLIETLADRIARALLAEPRVTAVTVTVHKPDAPMPPRYGQAAVTVYRTRQDQE